MEESVWMYFGAIAFLIMLGIIGSIVVTYEQDHSVRTLTLSVEQLGREADIVCRSQKGTRLSLTVPIPAHSRIYTQNDKLCGVLDNTIKCTAIQCLYGGESTILDLRDAEGLTTSRDYTCSFVNDDVILVDCQG